MKEELNQQNIPYNEKKNRKIFNTFVSLILVVFLMGGSFLMGVEKEKRTDRSAESDFSIENVIILNKDANHIKDSSIDFKLFWKTWDLLKEKYVDPGSLDAKKLFYGAISGMLSATGDPHNTFFTPEEKKEFNEDIKGSFDGIGVEIGIKNGVLTVIAPLENTPAERSGLRPGDKIIKIENEFTSNMSIDQSVKKMRGKKGTKVSLSILREGRDETEEMIIERDTISVKSVKIEEKSSGIFYVKISRFGEETYGEFNNAVSQMVGKKIDGVIIDLRNNPGGYLESSIDIASRMLPKNKVVVIEESQGGKKKHLTANGGDVLSQIPTIILINEGSASASEILAGALNDNRDNVTLVGKHTFGKGSVQEFIDLPDGTAVKITVARWLTPNGEQINNKGIIPEVEIDLTHEDYEKNNDPQLEKALEIIQKK